MNGNKDTFSTTTTTDQQRSLFNTTITEHTLDTGIIGDFRLSLLSPGVKIPGVVFLVLVMLLGILGNTLVLAVNYRIVRKTAIDIFVSGMGILDVIACFFIVPSRLLELTVNFWIIDSGGIMCKITRYIAHAIVLSSVFILGLIGIERFQKICRNKSFIDSDSCARKALAKLVAFTLILTLPTFIYHNLSEDNEQCVLDLNSQIARIYMACLCVLVILLFLLVLTLYCMIAFRIHRYTKVFDANITIKSNVCKKINERSQQMQQLCIDELGSATMAGNPRTSTSFIEQNVHTGSSRGKSLVTKSDVGKRLAKIDQIQNITEKSMITKRSSIVSNILKRRSNYSKDIKHPKSITNTETDKELHNDICVDKDLTVDNTCSHTRPNTHNVSVLFSIESRCDEAVNLSTSRRNGVTRTSLSSKLHERNVLLRLKATRIVIAVTVVFFISWTPPWIATFLGYSEHSNAMIEMYPILLFAMRSHYISFFINPILYSLMNGRFRQQAKQLFTDLRNG